MGRSHSRIELTVARRLAGLRAGARALIAITVLLASPRALAQLTHQQKQDDFRTLLGLFDKQYAPYDWKRTAFGFDLLDVQPWLQQVNASHDDVDFYDVCVRYVASLNDSHSQFFLPAPYEAYLPLLVDLYDGKVLIDLIDRTALDAQHYPFAIGDEVLSVDGRSTSEWIEALRPYAENAAGNPLSRDRIALASMIDRYQPWYPFANRIRPGAIATIVIRRLNGSVETYTIPWRTLGIPLDQVGPVPNPGGRAGRDRQPLPPGPRSLRDRANAADNRWGLWTGERLPRDHTPSVPGGERLERLQEGSAALPELDLAGGTFPFFQKFPLFNPPPGFILRLGARQIDEFVSGTFPFQGRTFGYIRIPSFSPTNRTTALAQFQAEVVFFQKNTSGLVIDLINNGGGSLCYANNLLQYLSSTGFTPIPFSLRATESWLFAFVNALVAAQLSGASQLTLDTLGGFVDAVQSALSLNRGMTDPIPYISPPFCSGSGGPTYPPARDGSGNNIAYTKPIVLLTNNFTLSAAETFSATLQDLGRATVYGVQTDGGGGNVVEYDRVTGPFSMGSVRVTQSIEVRSHPVSAPGLPSAPYIENIGVQPDVFADYQTRANLFTGGQPFVQGFSALIAGLAP